MLDLVNKAVDDNDIPKATEYAWSIANTICNQIPSTSSEPIWKNGEQSTIAALILLAAINSEFKFQKHMTTAYYLLAEYGQPLEDESIPLIDYIKTLPVKHPAKAAFSTASIAPYKTRASFFTSALADLRLFSDPTISDMTSRQDHSIENIGIEKTAVFLIVPDEDKTRNVLATIYIDQVYQSLVNLANKRGGRIPRRVNMLLDEFGNLPPIPEFDSKLTVAGGRGIRFTLAVQDVTQLKTLYDKRAQTITGNCHNWIYIKTADVETAKLISEKTGKYTVETENTSSSIQSKGHSRTHGVSITGRALVMPDEILRWDTNQSLVLPISYFPARYPLPDLSLWSANEELGFVMTGNIENDKETNRQIIEKRWTNTKQRELEETEIWLPDLSLDDDFSENEMHINPIKDNKEFKQSQINADNIEENTVLNSEEPDSLDVSALDLSSILESNYEDEGEEESFL
jgi:type IV secretion system protein VirD4